MYIVVQKCEEDALLREAPDGTCASGRRCACLGLRLTSAGSALRALGLPKCLLCYRRDGDPGYAVVPDGYPLRALTTIAGRPFVRFDPADYASIAGGGLVQFASDPGPFAPDTWMSGLVVTEHVRAEVPRVELFRCARCDDGVRNLLDSARSAGLRDSYLDVLADVVCCKKCDGPLEPVKAPVARCLLCETAMRFRDGAPAPICPGCDARMAREYETASRACAYCGRMVNVSRMTPRQSFFVRGRRYYLCRGHRADLAEASFETLEQALRVFRRQ